jgi:site-specific recombinase XerD
VLDFIYSPTHAKGRSGKAPAGGSVNVRLTHINSFYKFASQYSYTDEAGQSRLLFDHASPTTGVAYGKVDRKYRSLSHDELARLFAAIPKTVQGLRDKSAFICYLTTARRRQEIADLRFGDIEQGMIVENSGKRRVGWLFHFRNKGRKTEDDIAELPVMAKEAIDAYLVASGRMATMRADSPLFVAWDKRQGRELQLNGGTFEYQLKGYARAASLDAANITLHVFRHTAAKHRYEAGEDLRSIQRLLRHSNISTTDRYISQLMGTADEGWRLVESLYKNL